MASARRQRHRPRRQHRLRPVLLHDDHGAGAATAKPAAAPAPTAAPTTAPAVARPANAAARPAGGKLTPAWSASLTNVNPFQAVTPPQLQYFATVFSQLLLPLPTRRRWTRKLATVTAAPDASSYTFKLDPKAKFHDGQPLTCRRRRLHAIRWR